MYWFLEQINHFPKCDGHTHVLIRFQNAQVFEFSDIGMCKKNYIDQAAILCFL